MRIDACFDARSKSCAAEDKARGARLSFSYLNLADPDRPFPHRTNALGDRGSNRKKSQPSSSQSSLSRLHSSSVESLQSALMVRSNPIGLAEPSVKKDGYASQRASTEFLAETVRVETFHAERRSSVSGSGFRTGGGLIATGRPQSNVNMFLPFGASNNMDGLGQKWNRKISNGNGNSTGCSSNSSDDGKSMKDMSSSEASLFIAEGIKQMETLTIMATSEEAAHSHVNKPPLPRQSRPRMKAKVSTEKEEMTESVLLPSPFHAVDIALRSTLVEEPPVQVTVKRSRSLCRQTVTETRLTTTTTATELAEQQITISLPSSRRTSRHPSQERECSKKRKKHPSKSSKKGSQVEIYSGTFEVRVRKKASSQVLEIESNLVSLNAEDDVTVETHNVSSSDDSRVEAEVKESAGCDARTGDSDEKQERDAKSHSPRIEEQVLDLARGQEDCPKENEHKSADTAAETIPKKPVEGRVRHASDAGPTLQGLAEALESLQNQQRNSLLNSFGRTDSSSQTRQRRHSATSTAKCSGSATPSGALSRTRSRSGSLDLFSADYSLKVRHGSVTDLTETSTCHIRCDDQQSIDQLQLCARCHSHDHATPKCPQFGNLFCPRCLDWNHWEDTCLAVNMLCTTCNLSGHCPIVHSAENFEQRRVVVDTLGWEPFKVWFYESTFRSWWQLNGHVGVPLYKIYPRNSEWRYEIGALESDDENIEGLVKATCYTNRRTNIHTSSIVDRIKAGATSFGTAVAASKADSGGDSGRSTPEYLKKYPGSKDLPDDDDDVDDDVKDQTEVPPKMPTRLRTFSETLKMLDPDILAELNV
jgi:hypothetical protein